jgi:hypothetical protein
MAWPYGRKTVFIAVIVLVAFGYTPAFVKNGVGALLGHSLSAMGAVWRNVRVAAPPANTLKAAILNVTTDFDEVRPFFSSSSSCLVISYLLALLLVTQCCCLRSDVKSYTLLVFLSLNYHSLSFNPPKYHSSYIRSCLISCKTSSAPLVPTPRWRVVSALSSQPVQCAATPASSPLWIGYFRSTNSSSLF